MTQPDHERERLAAVAIAGEAGEELLELRGAAEAGMAPARLGDLGDRLAHDLIVRRLAEAFPDDPVLSEEGADGPERLGSRRVWIVDPLDGTREFSRRDRADWAVHLALVIDGRPVAAAVALPARRRVLSSRAGAATPPHDPARPLRMVVSRSRPPRLAAAIAARLGAELVPMGSAGAKSMAVVLGEADIYLHAGGQYEWDSAAPAGVALGAGLHVSRLDGSIPVYNQPDPWMPDQLICRADLADRILQLIAEAGPGAAEP